MNEPLPRVCPECGLNVKYWDCRFLKFLITSQLTDYHEVSLAGHFCPWCSYAAELFQDTDKGRIKYLPVQQRPEIPPPGPERIIETG